MGPSALLVPALFLTLAGSTSAAPRRVELNLSRPSMSVAPQFAPGRLADNILSLVQPGKDVKGTINAATFMLTDRDVTAEEQIRSVIAIAAASDPAFAPKFRDALMAQAKTSDERAKVEKVAIALEGLSRSETESRMAKAMIRGGDMAHTIAHVFDNIAGRPSMGTSGMLPVGWHYDEAREMDWRATDLKRAAPVPAPSKAEPPAPPAARAAEPAKQAEIPAGFYDVERGFRLDLYGALLQNMIDGGASKERDAVAAGLEAGKQAWVKGVLGAAAMRLKAGFQFEALRMETVFDRQAATRFQAAAEALNNGFDAMGDEIGRFGMGVGQIIGWLTDDGDVLRFVTTPRGGTRTFTITLRRSGGQIWFDAESAPAKGKPGTEVTLTKKEAVDVPALRRFLDRKFKYSRRGAVAFGKEILNSLAGLMTLDGRKAGYRLTDGGVSVDVAKDGRTIVFRDAGGGMAARVAAEALVVPGVTTKGKLAASAPELFYESGAASAGKAVILVGGTEVETIDVQGSVLAPVLVLDLPAAAGQKESRDQLLLDEPAMAAMKALIADAAARFASDPKRLAPAMNALSAAVHRIEESFRLKAGTDQSDLRETLKRELAAALKTLPKGHVLVPADAAGVFDVAGTEVPLDARLWEFDPKTVRATLLTGEGKAVWSVPMKSGRVFVRSGDNLLVDKGVVDFQYEFALEGQGPVMVNALFSVWSGYNERPQPEAVIGSRGSSAPAPARAADAATAATARELMAGLPDAAGLQGLEAAVRLSLQMGRPAAQVKARLARLAAALRAAPGARLADVLLAEEDPTVVPLKNGLALRYSDHFGRRDELLVDLESGRDLPGYMLRMGGKTYVLRHEHDRETLSELGVDGRLTEVLGISKSKGALIDQSGRGLLDGRGLVQVGEVLYVQTPDGFKAAVGGYAQEHVVSENVLYAASFEGKNVGSVYAVRPDGTSSRILGPADLVLIRQDVQGRAYAVTMNADRTGAAAFYLQDGRARALEGLGKELKLSEYPYPAQDVLAAVEPGGGMGLYRLTPEGVLRVEGGSKQDYYGARPWGRRLKTSTMDHGYEELVGQRRRPFQGLPGKHEHEGTGDWFEVDGKSYAAFAMKTGGWRLFFVDEEGKAALIGEDATLPMIYNFRSSLRALGGRLIFTAGYDQSGYGIYEITDQGARKLIGGLTHNPEYIVEAGGRIFAKLARRGERYSTTYDLRDLDAEGTPIVSGLSGMALIGLIRTDEGWLVSVQQQGSAQTRFMSLDPLTGVAPGPLPAEARGISASLSSGQRTALARGLLTMDAKRWTGKRLERIGWALAYARPPAVERLDESGADFVADLPFKLDEHGRAEVLGLFDGAARVLKDEAAYNAFVARFQLVFAAAPNQALDEARRLRGRYDALLPGEAGGGALTLFLRTGKGVMPVKDSKEVLSDLPDGPRLSALAGARANTGVVRPGVRAAEILAAVPAEGYPLTERLMEQAAGAQAGMEHLREAVQNAHKAMDGMEGEVKVVVDAVRTASGEQLLRVETRDEGKGMDAYEMAAFLLALDRSSHRAGEDPSLGFNGRGWYKSIVGSTRLRIVSGKPGSGTHAVLEVHKKDGVWKLGRFQDGLPGEHRGTSMQWMKKMEGKEARMAMELEAALIGDSLETLVGLLPRRTRLNGRIVNEKAEELGGAQWAAGERISLIKTPSRKRRTTQAGFFVMDLDQDPEIWELVPPELRRFIRSEGLSLNLPVSRVSRPDSIVLNRDRSGLAQKERYIERLKLAVLKTALEAGAEALAQGLWTPDGLAADYLYRAEHLMDKKGGPHSDAEALLMDLGADPRRLERLRTSADLLAYVILNTPSKSGRSLRQLRQENVEAAKKGQKLSSDGLSAGHARMVKDAAAYTQLAASSADDDRWVKEDMDKIPEPGKSQRLFLAELISSMMSPVAEARLGKGRRYDVSFGQSKMPRAAMMWRDALSLYPDPRFLRWAGAMISADPAKRPTAAETRKMLAELEDLVVHEDAHAWEPGTEETHNAAFLARMLETKELLLRLRVSPEKLAADAAKRRAR